MSETFIIAEIAQAHDGSLGIAHSYIDALAETGVNAIKFQTHIADAESSIFEPFRTKFSYEDLSRFDYWKRMEFTEEQWLGLRQHAAERNLEFISSPFSLAAVDLLERVGVKRYKIGSGEISNHLLLNRIGRTGKPVILSSGMSSMKELSAAIDVLNGFNIDISVLQCTTSYPTQPEQWGLNVIDQLKQFGIPVGFSDHSGEIFACLAAVTKGAKILEFHAVFDKQMFGPDAKSSLTISEIRTLVTGVRKIERSLATIVDKNNLQPYIELKAMFGKSLAVNQNLSRGSILSEDMLEAKKPEGYGIPAKEYKRVIGRTLTRDLGAFSFLSEHDLV